jgi:hypothetical protein
MPKDCETCMEHSGMLERQAGQKTRDKVLMWIVGLGATAVVSITIFQLTATASIAKDVSELSRTVDSRLTTVEVRMEERGRAMTLFGGMLESVQRRVEHIEYEVQKNKETQ